MQTTNNIRIECALAVLLGIIATPALAQTPLGSGFTYQGRLDLAGVPVNDTADFEVTLWDAATDGAMVGAPLEFSNVSVVDGLFTVQLDFSTVAFDGDARWLEIAVASPSGGAYTTLTPRQPLTAVPYALQTRGIYVDPSLNVGLGTDLPMTPLHVMSRFDARLRVETPSESYAGVLSVNTHHNYFMGVAGVGDGDPDMWHLFDNTNGARRMVVKGDGKVGIGTDTPATELDVAGTVTADAFVGDGSGLANVPADNLGDHTATQNLSLNGNYLSGDGDREGVFVDGGGNVGINVSTPAYPLEVGTDATNGNGAHLTAGGTWTNGSSRTFKSNFRPLDPQKVLDQVAKLPVLRWDYRGSNEGDHIGPMAEDFHAAFGLGDSDKYIATIDADGVALAAIQGLNQKLQALQAENAELKRQLAASAENSERIARLEALIAKMSAK